MTFPLARTRRIQLIVVVVVVVVVAAAAAEVVVVVVVVVGGGTLFTKQLQLPHSLYFVLS